MTASQSTYTRLIHPALRISASSGSPLAPPKASPCVLDLLDHARPQVHRAEETCI